MNKTSKKAPLGQKILYPILLMVLFQIFIFWLFVFQLGLFDSVVEQSRGFFLQNASIDSKQMDNEMWLHFSDLSVFSKSVAALKKEYLQALEFGYPLMIQNHIITNLVQESAALHIDGIYLELFETPDKRDSLHFRVDPNKLSTLTAKANPDFSTDVMPTFTKFSYNFRDENPDFRKFLKQIEELNQDPNSYDLFEHGNWSFVLKMDDQTESLFYAIPLNYKKVQYGILAVEIFTSRFADIMENSAFPENFPHQGLLIHYDRVTKGYEIISEVTYNMPMVERQALDEVIAHVLTGLSNSAKYTFESTIHNQRYFCSANRLINSSAEIVPFSTVSFYYLTLSPNNVVMHDSILLRRTFLFLVILFILFSVIISLFITKQVVSPISILTSAIKHNDFAQSDKCLPDTGITEIDILTSTISSQNKNLEDFHQMITDTMIASEINLVTFYTDKIDKITHGFGTFRALLGTDFSEDYVLKFSEEEFAELERKLYQNFKLYSSYCSQTNGNALQTDIYFDSQQQKYICVKSREMEHGRTRVFLDYTSHVLEQEQIKKERDHDVLTSLLNRFSFTQKAIDYLNDHPGQAVGMAMWDLDFLKTLNDTYGHEMGDLYLCTAGEILSQLNPDKSFVARVSGDEFFAFLFDYDSKESMVNDINITHQRLNQASIRLTNGHLYQMSASCGYTYSNKDSYDELKRKADSAMYHSKKSAKGSIHEYIS